MKNYYEILGVNQNANPDEIKAAYKTKAQKMHPDKGGDELEFMWLQEAYAVLSDEKRREQYDLTGDGDKTDLDALARQTIVRLFMSVIDGELMADGPVKTTMGLQALVGLGDPGAPIIKTMHGKLVNRNRDLKKAKKILKDQINKLAKLRAGIKNKAAGKNDILAALFDDKSKDLHKQLHMLDTEKLINEQALDMLDDYEDIVAGASGDGDKPGVLYTSGVIHRRPPIIIDTTAT